jgi:hypothetical protein
LALFADDINILVIDKDKDAVQQKINKVRKQLETWFQVNNLLINIKKQLLCHSILVKVGLWLDHGYSIKTSKLFIRRN